jgi:hypothetical protein
MAGAAVATTLPAPVLLTVLTVAAGVVTADALGAAGGAEATYALAGLTCACGDTGTGTDWTAGAGAFTGAGLAGATGADCTADAALTTCAVCTVGVTVAIGAAFTVGVTIVTGAA